MTQNRKTREVTDASASLPARLTHVRWLGGGSGAGKSTVARRLAEDHGLRLVATDELMADHARRLSPDRAPALAAFAAMTMDERWVERKPQEMLATFHWFRGEGFDLIVEDLAALPTNTPVLVEGFRLLPHLVAPLLRAPDQAVWLLPTPGFRRQALEARGGLWAIAGRTRDPDRALANLLERDRLFTARLAEETTALGLATIDVDDTAEEDDLVEAVGRALGL